MFKGVLGQAQVDGMDGIIDEWERRDLTDLRWLAYMFSTTMHETAFTMMPIKEYGKGKGRKYGVPDPQTGQIYYGRGFVQLTWKYNYEKAGKHLDADFVKHPDLVMSVINASAILFDGMIHGWFTGKKLSDYIHGASCDYVNARRIINGTDKASTLAGYAKKFEHALRPVA